MQYQAIKHLKTKSKLLGYFSTIEDAREAIRIADPRAKFTGFSYMGDFPYFHDTETQDARPYTIQGSVEIGRDKQRVVCSIKREETAKITN